MFSHQYELPFSNLQARRGRRFSRVRARNRNTVGKFAEQHFTAISRSEFFWQSDEDGIQRCKIPGLHGSVAGCYRHLLQWRCCRRKEAYRTQAARVLLARAICEWAGISGHWSASGIGHGQYVNVRIRKSGNLRAGRQGRGEQHFDHHRPSPRNIPAQHGGENLRSVQADYIANTGMERHARRLLRLAFRSRVQRMDRRRRNWNVQNDERICHQHQSSWRRRHQFYHIQVGSFPLLSTLSWRRRHEL